jgi:ABC-2 type transport system permease protein
MRAALVIAARSLRQRVRDRSAVMFAVLVPLGLAAAFSLLIPQGPVFHTAFVVHDADRGAVAAALADHLMGPIAQTGVADVTRADTAVAALARIDDGTASVAILIPEGFSDAVTTGRATDIRIVADPESPLGAQIAGSIVRAFANEVGAIQLAITTTAAWEPGQPAPSLDPAAIAQIQAAPPAVAVTDTTLERRQAGTSTFYAASMAIMFIFFATIYGPIGLLSERRTGTLARLLAAPIRPASLVLGAALVSFVLGAVSITVLVLATTILLGATWGPAPFVALLAFSAVVAAMGLSMLICTLARTEEQAGGWNAMVAITLAVLGGSLISLAQAPEILRQIGRITPHAWFLEAIDNMSAPSVALADILPAVAVMLGFGLVTGAVGLLRARSFLVPR